jgi:isopenicillin N synthase-like dioxygenase
MNENFKKQSEPFPPLIDLSTFYNTIDGTSTEAMKEKMAVAKKLRKACVEVGFFQVTAPCLNQEIISKAFDATRDFFNLPLDVKESASAFNSPLFRGYQGITSDSHSCTPTEDKEMVVEEVVTDGEQKEKTIVKKKKYFKKDVKESFTIGATGIPLEEEDIDPSTAGGGGGGGGAAAAAAISKKKKKKKKKQTLKMIGPNNWPNTLNENTVIRKHLKRYWLVMLKLSKLVSRCLALSLGMNETYFVKSMNNPVAQMVLLKYPIPMDNQQSCGAHTDCGWLTLLAQDHPSDGGLEIQNNNGQWVTVTQINNAVLVNLGDMASLWSNYYYKSTLHRVKSLKRIRHSIPFFCNLNYDAVVNPQDICNNATVDVGTTAKAKPILAGDYLCQKLGLMHDGGGGGDDDGNDQ